jgi:hypothetical protein
MRKLVAIAFGALSISLLAGCETKGVIVEVPDFDASAIQAIWLWRLSETSGEYERVCQIELTPGDDGTSVAYIQRCPESGDGYLLSAQLEPLPNDPSGALLDLWYMRFEDPGTYRASLVNEWGESDLSPTPIPL